MIRGALIEDKRRRAAMRDRMATSSMKRPCAFFEKAGADEGTRQVAADVAQRLRLESMASPML
jgi:hypothetical protein